MPRTVSWSTESPFRCEQFHSAFSDEDYWLARLGQYNAGTDILDSLIVDGDGDGTVAITLSVW